MSRFTFIVILLLTYNLSAQWNLTQTFGTPSGYHYDFFGFSLDCFGNQFVAGAPFSDQPGQGNVGSAHIFEYNGSWVHKAEIFPTDLTDQSRYGWSVAMDNNRIAVGAKWRDPSYMGGVYVYEFNGTDWIETAILTPSDSITSGYFGTSVDIKGDRIFVGTPGIVSTGNAGAVYVYDFNGTNWIETAKLSGSGENPGNDFGCSVSVSVNGDRLVVGALDQICAGIRTGAAYLFKHNGAQWVEEFKFEPSDGLLDDQFGYSVDILDTVIIVGAKKKEYNSNLDNGSAYIYRYTGSFWIEEIILRGANQAINQLFGRSVALADNLAIIGSNSRAEIYKYSSNAWTAQADLFSSSSNSSFEYGIDVDFSYDIGAFVGDPYYDYGGNIEQGAVLFYGYSYGVGLEDISESNVAVKIGPNPVKDLLTIEVVGSKNRIVYQLVNVLGETVNRGSLVEYTAIEMLQNLSGLYILELKDANGNLLKRKKILKE